MKPIHILIGVLVVAVAFFGYNYWQNLNSGGDFAAVEREALAFYQQANPGLTNLSAEVIDYGCHIEIEIRENGQRLTRLGWAGQGRFYELGR
ncbi:MAG: hypothetical protein DDT34_00917 [Firmicutes bacterium]|nr:hypothetical protein [Bacillota bacterium]